jgi:hypothetical protein
MESPYITCSIAARYYLKKSSETVRRMCVGGIFKTARQIGFGKNPHWQIARTEVAALMRQTKTENE